MTIWFGKQMYGESPVDSNLQVLGENICAFGGMKEEIYHRIAEEKRMPNSYREIGKKRNLFMKLKIKLLKCRSVPIVHDGFDTQTLNSKIKKNY